MHKTSKASVSADIRSALALRLARVAAGLTQQELADALDLSKQAITKMESLQLRITEENQDRFRQFFVTRGIQVNDNVQNLHEELRVRVCPDALYETAMKISRGSAGLKGTPGHRLRNE